MRNNKSWKLETFIDSLTIELDKVRETLAVKAINKPLTYSVKDVSLDLQIFPEFDGDDVTFLTAKPGQEGASKVSLQLGSITDRQVRETSKTHNSEDVSIESVEDIDDQTKKELRKIGVTSINDFKKTEPVVRNRVKNVNYQKLANIINKSRRGKNSPLIRNVSLSKSGDQTILNLTGEHLVLNQEFKPVAKINNNNVKVIEASERHVSIDVGGHELSSSNEVMIAFDPYAIYTMNLKN